MPSVVTFSTLTLAAQLDLQRQVIDLFDQDYIIKFDVNLDDVLLDRDHPRHRQLSKANFILSWVMGRVSDHPERMVYEHRCMDAESREQLEDFLHEIKDELSESWRRRATMMYIPL